MALGRANSTDAVQRACQDVVDALLAAGHDLPSVYLLLGGRLRCQAARGYFQVVDGFPAGTGVIGRVVATGQPAFVDAEHDPSFIAAVPGLRSELCVPVLLDGVAVGAVNVESRELLDTADLASLQEVARGLGDRLLALGGLPRPSPAQHLARLAVELTVATDAAAVRQRVVQAAVELSGVPTAALLALSGAPHVQAAVGPLAHRLDTWGQAEVDVAAGWVQAGTSTHFPGGEAVPAGYDFLVDAGVAGLSVQPLVVSGELVGLLVTVAEQPVRLSPQVVEALELLAAQAAASLELLATRAELAAERDEAQRRAALNEAVLETVDVGVVACDADGRLTLFNRATREFHGLDADAGLDPSQHAAAYDLRDEDGVTPLAPERVPLHRVLRGEQVRDVGMVIARADAAPRSLVLDGSRITGPDGAVAGAVVTMRDVTSARQAAADLAASEHLFRAAFVDGPTPSLRLDETGVVQAVNAALRRLLGLPTRLVVGRPLAALVHPDDHGLLREVLDGLGRSSSPVELRLLALSGGTVWCDVAATSAQGRGGEPHVLVQMVDVSARLHREQELEKAARRDALTGLGNRAALDAILARAAREQAPVGLLFVDLDGFKAVNDRHGHEAGDAVLVEVALRLRAAVRAVDTVVRLGGDEFVVVCPQLTTLDEAELLADRLERLLSAPVDSDGLRLAVGASVGSAVGPHDDPATLLAAADRSMYARKESRGRRRSDDPSSRPVVARRRNASLSALVAGAVEEGRVRLDYQPVVRVSTGEVVGAEALLRMTDRAGRSLAPDAVVPVAETEGTIGVLGAWVLREALAVTGAWKRQLPPEQEFGIGVNLSALQLHEPGLVELVADALAASGTDPGALVLEVTETRLVPDTLEIRETLTALRDLGVHLAVDDFGTGYASPRYLADFPFDVLKIDRRWTRRLSGSGAASRLATGVFRLAETTGLVVIAEGVEDDAERDAVLAQGVDLAQGYRWSRPVPPEVFAARLLPRPAVPQPRARVAVVSRA
ncbi:MAG: hypothetical protein JWO60_2256 [Frankiales bacterium]|nr:hypothetical protein [Frankiales bacterium]